MGDLLIRNLDPDTKSKLQESARKSGRSLSDEAAIRLKDSLVTGAVPRQPIGQRLRDIIDGFELTNEERAAIAASRREPDREPPAFGSRP
jgi:plasmid stability protein